jgi:AAA family ATP:ADP antiporter
MPRDKTLNLTWFERTLSLFTRVRPGEGRCIAILLAHAGLLMTAYYLVRPVREALILTEGSAELRSYAVGIQALLLIVLIPLYGAVFRIRDSSLLIQRVNVFFVVNLAIFAVLAAASWQIGFAFFIWVSIFGVMVVAQFWAFATDLFNVKSGQRLFAIIAVGVSGGAWVGARIAASLFEQIGPAGLIMLSAAVLGSTLVLSRSAERSIPDESRSVRVESEPDSARKWLGGFALIARDSYLVMIAALVVLLNWITSNGDYILSDWLLATAQNVPESERQAYIGTFMGNMMSWITLLGLLLQMFLVSRVIITFGVPLAICVAPLAFAAGYMVIGVVPVFALLQWVLIAQRSLDYSILNTSRNVLLLPASRGAKYEAKTAIDTFFFRFGDMLSAGGVFLAASLFSANRMTFVWFNLALGILMLTIAVRIGREYSRRAAAPDFNMPPSVQHEIEDHGWRPGDRVQLQLPRDTFVDADPGDVLTLSARRHDGQPLPDWLSFDASRHTLEGDPPHQFVREREIHIEITATDFDGATASQRFRIYVLETHS